MSMWHWLRFAVLSIALSILPVAAHALSLRGEPIEGPTSPLSVTTTTGVYPFEVELALTDKERAFGLMNRRQMARTRGMLFDMERTAEATFWMEDTYLPLDIIFIGEDGKVFSITENAVPFSKDLIPSNGPIRFVLELNAGMVELTGMEPGDRVHHDIIDAVAGK